MYRFAVYSFQKCTMANFMNYLGHYQGVNCNISPITDIESTDGVKNYTFFIFTISFNIKCHSEKHKIYILYTLYMYVGETIDKT